MRAGGLGEAACRRNADRNAGRECGTIRWEPCAQQRRPRRHRIALRRGHSPVARSTRCVIDHHPPRCAGQCRICGYLEANELLGRDCRDDLIGCQCSAGDSRRSWATHGARGDRQRVRRGVWEIANRLACRAPSRLEKPRKDRLSRALRQRWSRDQRESQYSQQKPDPNHGQPFSPYRRSARLTFSGGASLAASSAGLDGASSATTQPKNKVVDLLTCGTGLRDS